MKRSWLRGTLLGVSLALLLAGGVALAQMTLTVNPDCIECWPRRADPDEEHVVVATLDDYLEADLCGRMMGEGEVIWAPECVLADHLSPPPCEVRLAIPCGALPVLVSSTCQVVKQPKGGPPEVVVANGPAEYGDCVLSFWQEENGDPIGEVHKATFRYAEVCEAEEQFVSEPGTIILLGSGLAGLAGYGALRWRSRR